MLPSPPHAAWVALLGLRVCAAVQVAAFLRAQQDNLDKTQLGELLGHHEDFAVAVMHAWVDSEPSMAGQAIDQSLRRLLSGFRLPGEAQKIDRIMEKFAEVRRPRQLGCRCWLEGVPETWGQ